MRQSLTFHWTLIFSSIKLGCSVWWSPKFFPAVSPSCHLCAGWINFGNEIANMLQEDTFTPILVNLFIQVKGKQGHFRWKPHPLLHLVKAHSDSCDWLVRALTRQHPFKETHSLELPSRNCNDIPTSHPLAFTTVALKIMMCHTFYHLNIHQLISTPLILA